MKRPAVFLASLVLGLALAAAARAAQPDSLANETAAPHAAAQSLDSIAQTLTTGSFVLLSDSGTVLGQRTRGEQQVQPLFQKSIVETLQGTHLDAAQAARLWSFFADQDNASMATLEIVKTLAAASDSPKAREALWSELAALARVLRRPSSTQQRERSLLGTFERSRAELLPLLGELHETAASCDEMIELMFKSRVFADDLNDSVAEVSGRIPAAVARYIEDARERGRAVRWEYLAYESMVRWKNEHLLPGAAKAPRTPAALDEAGEAFITTFNSLHALDEGFREVILRDLGAPEIFNAVVGGEKELYRLGTSGYRGHLHAIIMRGINEAGSFEAFLEQAASRLPAGAPPGAASRRGMVYLRVVSSFGLLEPVLETVRDKDRFLSETVASLADPVTFEGNSAVLLDLLTTHSASPAAIAFKQMLLERLYERYRAETGTALRSVYGSMLSVYQGMSGDHRDHTIDAVYALDAGVFRIPFQRLFSASEKGGFIHRMFMRMEATPDADDSYSGFRALMSALGAKVYEDKHFDVFVLASQDRTIEIYANRPTDGGVRFGVANIAERLRGKRVETVIGRGHTSIIAPLQQDSKHVLGGRVKEVATVIVGSCGGDASVRELIASFGYVPFFTTKSTGRKVINDAIINSYVAALMALPADGQLSIGDVLERATARYQKPWIDESLREDARLYQVNMTTVLTAFLFDTHVRPHLAPLRHAANQ